MPARRAVRRPKTRRQFLATKRKYIEVDRETGCWTWIGSKSGNGYGRTRWNQVMVPAHRLVYECYCGEIAEDMHVDHLCENKVCVNPLHLEAVSKGENQRRWYARMRGDLEPRRSNHLHKSPVCKNGHDRIDNMAVSRGSPYCLACKRERARKSYRNGQEERLGNTPEGVVDLRGMLRHTIDTHSK